MKGKKCGLLLALFITLGLSLSISLNDTSALKYNIQKIPITSPGTSTVSPNFYSDSLGFQMITSSEIDTNLLTRQYVVSMYEDDGTCKGRAYTQLPTLYYLDNPGRIVIKYGFNGFDDNFTYPSNFYPFDRCISNGPLSNYDSESVGSLVPPLSTTMSRSDLTSLLPYRFKWDGFFRTDSRNSDGLYYSNKFDFHNLFNYEAYPEKIYDVYIPFGSGKSDVSNTLTNDMPIEFSGEFVIDLEDPSSSFGLSGTTVSLETYYMSGNGGDGPDISSCTWNLAKDDPNDPTSVYSFSYSCPTTLRPSIGASSWDTSSSIPYFRLHINFQYETENTKFFQFIYDSSVTVTNNDSTPGGDWDEPVDGADPHDAPGSAYQNVDDQEPDYGTSLERLFNFSFINPFEPILHLFTDSNSCVQIPTIASMIHSDETQVCPWFDSNVRSIVTPVLGISSMMLVFGFAVRWLGARSGNLFEDSFEGTSGDISVGSRGRSKK